MSSKKRPRQLRKPRSLVVLGMIVSRKGGPMADRRLPRGGARNRQREIMAEASQEA